MVKLSGLISHIQSRKILVVGDFILDKYTIGKAKRISPEAPVAVVNVLREEYRPGGAGNVILNLLSMGAEVVSMGRIGEDPPGEILRQSLYNEGIDLSGLVIQKNFSTPLKNRIFADNQQIVRVDHESVWPLSEELEKHLISLLPKLLQEVKAIAISDYGKGFLSYSLLASLIQQSKAHDIPIITDPKGTDFAKYRGSTIIKPNLGEAYAAANLAVGSSLENVATRVLALSEADTLMITRSEEGITLFSKEGSRKDFPARIREVKDVTGAGDTVLAMVACGLANHLPLPEIAQLSNIAAGIAIEHFGCARVTLSQLARRLLQEDIGNKVFDKDHLFALQEALKNDPFALLSIQGKAHFSPELFKSIRQIAQSSNMELLIHLTEVDTDPDLINLLASLHEVHFIVLYPKDSESLCSLLKPKATFVL